MDYSCFKNQNKELYRFESIIAVVCSVYLSLVGFCDAHGISGSHAQQLHLVVWFNHLTHCKQNALVDSSLYETFHSISLMI